MNLQSVGWFVARLLGRSVCHGFLKGVNLCFYAPIGPLVYILPFDKVRRLTPRARACWATRTTGPAPT